MKGACIGGFNLPKQKLILKNSGNRYKSDGGDIMVEYHVSSLSLFLDRMSTTEFGGNLSI
jgi:hypothetical protein